MRKRARERWLRQPPFLRDGKYRPRVRWVIWPEWQRRKWIRDTLSGNSNE
jgi:hypothetical protein